MKSLKFLLAAVMLFGMAASGPAWANRGHSGGNSGAHFHHHHHGGFGFVFAAPLFYPWYERPPPPPVYIEKGDAAGYWYYCSRPPGYFPAVRECPAGWTKVIPGEAP